MSSKIYTKAVFGYREDTLENWQANNPVLERGEPAIVRDGVDGEWLKIGDGVTSWNDLPWKKGPRGEQGPKGAGVGQLTDNGGEIFNLYEETVADLGNIGGISIGTQKLSKNQAGQYAHAQGVSTKAIGRGSHSEGVGTAAEAEATHAEGAGILVTGAAAHGEGRGLNFTVNVTDISDNKVTVKSNNTSIASRISELESIKKNAIVWFEKDSSDNTGRFYYVTAAETQKTLGVISSCIITLNSAPGFKAGVNLRIIMGGALSYASHIEGNFSNTVDIDATNLVNMSESALQRQHAEGSHTLAIGLASHAEGEYSIAKGFRAHAEGYDTAANGYNSHSEGCETIAEGSNSHAGGYKTQALGDNSHAEGKQSVAGAICSFAGGANSVVGETAENGFAHGYDASATRYKNEVAFGNNNLEEDGAIFMIGNGYWGKNKDGTSGNIKKNAFVIKSTNPNGSTDWGNTTKAWAEVDSQGETDKSVVILKTFKNTVEALEKRIAELEQKITDLEGQEN